MAFMFDGVIINNLTFYLMQPDYICSNERGQYHCSVQEACKNLNADVPEFKVSINWNNGTSLHNWIQDFDLMCAPSYQIGLIGTTYFLGIVLGNIFLARLGDVYGAMPLTRIALVITLVIVFLLMFVVRSLASLYFLLFVFGLFNCWRAFCPFLYAQEIVLQEDSKLVGSIFLCMTTIPSITYSIYFQSMSKDWFYATLFYFTLLLIATCISFYLPQSPRFFASKLQFEEAKRSLNFIAKMNRKKQIDPEMEMFTNELHTVEVEMTRDQDLINEINDFSLGRLLADRVYATNLAIICFCWCGCMYSFFIITFNMKYFPANIYSLVIMACLVEVFAYLISGTAS
eukprot:CAMPEP_0202961014 /NCGR_PEP_ID=MMETSP1396-20130829/5117_1 /ASSEMBLY_ACC=CAM_ASM_000872 /TAXON_ID= /ORGANISM="Pseudokeronopsis sp., Strain Brazil" /LENGTH=342 /DNA_ID=CAMNT_0049680571 /DNA_START=163 /DNA_END=1191 /DNA_ORIENTATION=+